MSTSAEGRPIPYHRMGFATEQDANAASARVARAIDEFANELQLSLAGLDGVTIAHDYDAALAALDRGYEASSPLSRTNDGVGDGCAMAPLVLRNGQVMSHLVFAAFVVPLIDAPQSGVNGKYIVAHELAHVHEHYFRDRVLPNTLLRIRIPKADEAFLYDLADTCWSEYVACFISSSVHPEQVELLQMPLLSLLPNATSEIVAAKNEWLLERNIGKLWQRAGAMVCSILKYFSYLLGHAAGLDKPPSEVAPAAWTLLSNNPWLFTWVERLNQVLSSMLETFAEWKSLEVFDPLKQLARGLLADCGIAISDSNGSLYVSVGAGKLRATSI
jgi:hypothetical protein